MVLIRGFDGGIAEIERSVSELGPGGGAGS